MEPFAVGSSANVASSRVEGVRHSPIVTRAMTLLVVVVLVVSVLPVGGRLDELFHLLPNLMLGGAMLAVVLVHRLPRPEPWLLVASGYLLAAAVDPLYHAGWLGGTAVVDSELSVAAVDALSYPALFVGTLAIAAGRRYGRHVLAGSEPLIHVLALTAIIWITVTGPFLATGELPVLGGALPWMRALFELVLALLVLYRTSRTFGAGRFRRRVRIMGAIIAGGLLLEALGHAVVATRGEYPEPGTWLAPVNLAGHLLLAVFVTTRPFGVLLVLSGRAEQVHWSQIFSLLAAVFVPGGLMIVLLLADDDPSRTTVGVTMVAMAVIAVLALLRTRRLVLQIRELTEQRSSERLAAMFGHSTEAVLLLDRDGVIRFAGNGLLTLLGHDPDEWVGRPATDLLAPDQRSVAAESIARIAEAGYGSDEEGVGRIFRIDGEERRVKIVIANFIGGSAVDGLVATFTDVTEQRRLERALYHRAYHDDLTGLGNRALFLERMEHALRAERPDDDPLTVLFVDLDDFKSVNDALGHEIGDKMLRSVADRLRSVAGPDDLAARLGGDEFAVLLEGAHGLERSHGIGEALLHELRRPVTAGEHEIVVLASVGIAVATPGTTTSTLLRDADVAMYEAKRAGKGQVRLFDPMMRRVVAKHLEYRTALALALERSELRLVFMPYVDLRTGRLVGAEALVRWHHPEFGEIEASEFVPIAERSGLMVPMGYWIIERAFDELAQWRNGPSVSVNLSATQIRQPDFVDRVLTAADRTGIDGRRVVFEISESLLATERDRIAEVIVALRGSGFRFAIDDFGVDDCSLVALQQLPVDIIKVDRALIEDLVDSPDDSLARTILVVAESLGLVTVAEGVETLRQWNMLRQAGCELAQGFLMVGPLEADDMRSRLSAETARVPG